MSGVSRVEPAVLRRRFSLSAVLHRSVSDGEERLEASEATEGATSRGSGSNLQRGAPQAPRFQEKMSLLYMGHHLISLANLGLTSRYVLVFHENGGFSWTFMEDIPK